jgi:hypothetical protein
MKSETIIILGIFVLGVICLIIMVIFFTPHSPMVKFQNDQTLIESCYLNITGVEKQTVERNMEVRMEKVYIYHKECVDRNLKITSVGNELKMETKLFGNYVLQGATYVKFSANSTHGLKYGDLV